MKHHKHHSRSTEHGARCTVYLYGRRPIWEAFRANKRSMHKLWMVHGTTGDVIEEILSLAKSRGVPIDWVDRDRLDRMVRGNHQGVAAQVSATAYVDYDAFIRELPADGSVVVLLLDEIEDPQNVGAILRNAGFFGVAGVIIPRWRSAPVSESALRASAGAAEHVSVIRVRNLVDTIEDLKKEGFEIWGADMAGESLWSQTRSKRHALVLGSEGSGLRRLVKEHCDKLVAIPAQSPVGSLNVAATAAIFLYEFFRPR
jgi:23S rRNA (guanosine2251-2'-O)-methyltransferase